MVSDSELIERLRQILGASDLSKTTTSIVRRRLEEEFGIDLSEKKAFVREQVELFLQNEFEKSEEEEDDDDRTVEEGESEESNGSDLKHNEEEDDKREVHRESGNGKRKRRPNKLHNESKKHGGGYGKMCRLSPKLQEFIGVPEMARTEVIRRIGEYIREKNLQDINNKQNIICDEPMRALFGVNSINMLQINNALSEHIRAFDPNKVVATKSIQKQKPRKKKREVLDESELKENNRKRGKWGFLAPLQLSDALVNFLATGENVLARSDVIKRMWVYIKEHNLQDPTNRKRIICDEKLKELFGVESFDGFTVTKHLSAHFIKA